MAFKTGWTRRKLLFVLVVAIIAIAAVGKLVVDQALTAVIAVFSSGPEVNEQVDRATRQPLAAGSHVSWDGRNVARLLWSRGGVLTDGGIADSLRIYQGEWSAVVPQLALSSLAGSLIWRAGDPPFVQVELADTSEVRDRTPIGQLWIGSTVIWLYPGPDFDGSDTFDPHS